MIKLTDHIWIGCRTDIRYVGYIGGTIANAGAVLNVAKDLPCEIGWPDVEYAQVGLLDGPGNEVVDYCAVLLSLAALLRRHEGVLVYDHDGSRALAVGIMYLSLKRGKDAKHPSYQVRYGWRSLLTEAETVAGIPLESPHVAHKEAFERMPFGLLEALV